MPSSYLASVQSVAQPMPGVHLLYLHSPELAQIARAGQFVMVRCGEGADPYMRQPLPLHRISVEGVALCFRASRPETRSLGRAAIGEVLDLYGPLGRGFTLPHDSSASLTLVAQGDGYMPLLSLLDIGPHPIQIILWAPTRGHIYPRELLPRQAELFTFVGHGDEAVFWEAVRAACRSGDALYGGGPVTFYQRLAALVADTRLRHQVLAQVWYEGDMPCGRGFCQGCSVPTHQGVRQLCVDGPALDLADLIFD